MAHKTHMVAQVKHPHPVVHATPYHYFGRTHDGAPKVPTYHRGGTVLRRSGLAKGPTMHGLQSWLERGGGHAASYKD
jgi:hypothetical protein